MFDFEVLGDRLWSWNRMNLGGLMNELDWWKR